MRKFMGVLLAAVVFGMITTGAFAANGPHRHHAKRHHTQQHHQAR